MKKLSIIFIVTILFSLTTLGQLKVASNGWVQVDYTSGSQALTFGDNVPGYISGKWAIEHWGGGLNFFVQWPNTVTQSTNYTVFLEDVSGYVGIHNGNPSYQLDVNGDIATYGTIRISSDKRFKTDIKPITSSMEKLAQLEGVSYKMKKSKKNEYDLNSITDTTKRQAVEAEMALYESVATTDKYGFIAQELKEIFPELVDQDNEGYLNIDYIGLIPVLVEAIKELQEKVETIENNCCNNSSSLKNASIGTSTTLTQYKAKLDQNIPNPFSQETRIDCFIPEGSNKSVLYIYNMNGTQLQQYSINGLGDQSVTISGNTLEAGMYIYALVIDGREVDTKRMILTK